MSTVDLEKWPIGAEGVGPLRSSFPRDLLLRRIGGDIRALLGPERVQRVVLFGSRARGEAREEGGVDDSDWDVAVFVRGDPPTRGEREGLTQWWVAFGDETGWAVSPMLFPENGWKERTIFMHNLRFDMIEL